jgi:sulfur-oxidizing protein SoxB
MIRVGGMNYTCDPIANMNHRISNMTMSDGRILNASKQYKVSGWATVRTPSSEPPVWDVVAEYLRDHKKIKVSRLNSPKLTNVENSPGLADYSAV